ncbi:Vibriobactin receptor [Vibrio nigripulchritudo SO65]|uniref:TonB-dependent receptor plug domain-containing protein n=1 Tax=Vibrio nigripulchritudo TaxID=28173 RepID=UPI0003B20E43|nr:TonB-dependent receptor plug domain-containing protein [Vibrio nigripulchritudo]CCN36983.1 Vibriobactin receptor [Vibrio nigripulchritudo AM115]CCN41796.1 Vibriobactin receptor [Vibrio nigripulchritudo FTn2]CCN66410.1 Vibriobactin receptor [Vibrio nigripulchritudo POn4]CCN74504.1 Vibriobactin receptor [Vibrio nigripulchritudo SO65]
MTALRPARMNVPGNKTFKMRTLSAVIMGLCVGGQAFAETNNNNDAATQDGTISVVTVIGEKTERSIYNTGSSVEVFDEDRINTTPGATEVDDLLQLTPNIVDSGQGNNLPAIRGVDGSGPSIGGLASFAGTAPRINLSIDGRSLTYSELTFGPRSLWDMQQAEVYLGPQSYAQGRSASAGAIVIKSKDPTYHFESAVKGAIAEQNYTQTAAMISAPIVEDELAFRLSVDQQKRKTHVDLATYDPVGDARRIEMTTARGKFLYEPSSVPGFKTTFTVTRMDTRSPQSEHEVGEIYGANRAIYETYSTSGMWDVSYVINDNITFENNVGYTKFGYDRVTDPTGGAQQDFYTDGKEIQLEQLVRISSDDRKLNSLYGLRYFRTNQDDTYATARGDAPMTDATTVTSAFAEITYAVAPQVDVTVAGRLETERKTRKVELLKLDHDESATVFLPKFDIAYKPEANQTFGFKVAKGYNSGAAGLSFYTKRIPKGQPPKPMIPYAYDSEFVWNYELYTRHRLNDGTLELTSNIFYNDYQDMQVQQLRSDFYAIVENIDGAKTYGAEVGSRWLATSDLEFFANLGLLKTSYTETEAQGGKTKELPRAPLATASLGGLYTFAEGFELSGNASYTGDYFSDLANTKGTKVDSYWIANAQLAYVFDGGRAALFAQNLFDSDAKTSSVASGSKDDPLRLAPRQIGASIELHF